MKNNNKFFFFYQFPCKIVPCFKIIEFDGYLVILHLALN
jgi:hypothetical protein